MASLKYLWANRSKPKFGTVIFFRTWAKRFFTFKNLLFRNYNRRILLVQGASISETAEISYLNFNGDKKKLRIGKNTFIGDVEFALHDFIIIGNHVCINDGVKLLTASHDLNDPEWKHKKAAIIIQDYAWVATSAIILPGVTIGEGAVVGAGAVVSKDVNPYSIVTGNPATILGKKRVKPLKYNPCEFLAENMAWLY